MTKREWQVKDEASALSFLTGGMLFGQAVPPASGLLQIRRIYVAPLTGGPGADALRDLIIAGMNRLSSSS